jgi:DNA-binding XRE family transcriptional regulator
MTIKREIRKIERTPAEKARLRRQRAALSATRPSLASLVESGKYDVVKQGDYQELMKLLSRLKRAREEKKLTLTSVAKRCGMDKAALSRLENGQNLNPTIGTLDSLARAVGYSLRMTLAKVPRA